MPNRDRHWSGLAVLAVTLLCLVFVFMGRILPSEWFAWVVAAIFRPFGS